jgi:excisionase family DNA binding protein
METIEEEVRKMTPISALPRERAEVVALKKALHSSAVSKVRRCELRGPNGELIPLPDSVFYLLRQVVDVMAQGDAITLVPVGRELTTQQAADLLNVSRQYLVRLLDQNRLPFRKTGKHRRIKIEDVLKFKTTRDQERRVILDDLTASSQGYGGYEDVVDETSEAPVRK